MQVNREKSSGQQQPPEANSSKTAMEANSTDPTDIKITRACTTGETISRKRKASRSIHQQRRNDEVTASIGDSADNDALSDAFVISGPSRDSFADRDAFNDSSVNNNASYDASAKSGDLDDGSVNKDVSNREVDRSYKNVENEAKKSKPIKIPSIHRLSLDQFDKKANEEQVIKQVVEKINAKLTTENKKRPTFNGPTSITELHGDPQINCLHPFKVSVYVRNIVSADAALERLGIEGEISSNDIMAFYYRHGDILVFTYGCSWQFLSHYTCVDFPLNVLSELTDPVGNYRSESRYLLGDLHKEIRFSGNPVEIPLNRLLTSVTSNLKLKVRHDSLFYNLYQFNKPTRKKANVQIQFGFSFIRILSGLQPKHIPELLNYLLEISRTREARQSNVGSTPFVIEEKKKRKEKAMLVQLIPKNHTLNEKLDCELAMAVHDLINSTDPIVNQYSVCGGKVAEWHESVNFKLLDGPKHKGTWVDISSNFPTTEEVFAALKKLSDKCYLSVDSIKKLKVVYYSGAVKERSVLFLKSLVGQVILERKIYWKLSGLSFYFNSDYFYILENNFVKILNQRDILLPQSCDAARGVGS